MIEDSPFGLLRVEEVTACESEKVYKNPCNFEERGWLELQKSTLKSPISTKLEKLEGLILCTIERRESKIFAGDDGGL